MSFGWRRGGALGALAFVLASGLGPDLPGPARGILPAPQAQAQSASFDLFFNSLDDYGTWIPDAEYGYIWTPQVGPGWQPYRQGSWAWTDDYGWMWQSREPFAWATYHYGRWGWNQFTGWYWVPGDEWAPAWVSWRRGGGVIGWAPLPPVGGGYAYGVPDRFEAPPRSTWIFVNDRDFTAPDLYARALPAAAMSGAYFAANRVYYPTRGNGYMVNRFAPREEIARVSLRPPEVRRVVPVDRRPDGRFYDDRVEVYRPRIDGRAPARPQHLVMDRPRREGLEQPYPARPDLGPARPGAVAPERPDRWNSGPGRPSEARPERPRPDDVRRPDGGRPGGERPSDARPERPRPDSANRPQAGQPDRGRPSEARPERPRPDGANRPQAERPSNARPGKEEKQGPRRPPRPEAE